MKKLLPLLFFICQFTQLWAQGNIPLGTWRTHFSYAQVQELALAGNRVYAASENGLFYYDKAANEAVTLTPLQGLSDVGVSALAWQEKQQLLLIGYRSGNIDLVQQGKVTNIPSIRTASLGGSKQLNEVVFRGDSAIIATDYGISIVDLRTARLLDSYLNLGPEGQRLPVTDLAVLNDTLYAVTPGGLISNRLSPSINLGYFGSWRRWGSESALPVTGLQFVETIGQQVVVAGDEGYLFSRNGNRWLALPLPFQEELQAMRVNQQNDRLLLSTANTVFSFNLQENSYTTLTDPLLQNIQETVQDAEGNVWVADGVNGLLSNSGGSWSSRTPSGPLNDAIEALQYANGQVLALYGGMTAVETPLGAQGFSVFSPASGWINYYPQQRAGSLPMPAMSDLTAAAFHPARKEWYLASFSDGLLAWDPQQNTFTTYTLTTPGVSFTGARDYPGKVLLSGIGVDATGNVWMSSYNSNRPLHRFNPPENTWQAYLEGNAVAASALQLIIPFTGDVWLRLDPELSRSGGLLVFNPQKQPALRQLGNTSGNGGLVSSLVYSLQEDLEGTVWVGTNDGISYFSTPGSVLSNGAVNASLPILQQRPLLDESRATAMAVDGGNRKWVGTNNGLWVFGDDGDTLYHHFTTANSPLPSNVISALSVHQQTGEVFIATDKGLVSYRSGATAGGATYASAIKVYPNPVRPDFNGQVGITGLVQDAVVKITDVAGFLVRELQAQGGTAAWNLVDSRGRRVSSGVYLVFSADATGTEALVGKIAVVR